MMRYVWTVLLVLLGAAYLFYLLLTNWMDGGTAAALAIAAVIGVAWYAIVRIRRGIKAGGTFIKDMINSRR